MKLEELKTITQLSEFLSGTQAVIFKVNTKEDRYNWLRHELVRFHYNLLGKKDKGIVIRYLIKVSNYSKAQMTRLIKQYIETGYIRHHHVTTAGFNSKYTLADINLLAKMDRIHDQACGHTIKNYWSAVIIFLKSLSMSDSVKYQ